jgi:thioredoxin reductase
MLADSPVSPLTAHGIMLRRRLGTAGAKLLFNTTVKKIEAGSVVISTDGKDRKIEPIDQVIVAVGVTPRSDLKEMLRKKNIRHFIIGDAREARRIIEATTEGAKAAWEV